MSVTIAVLPEPRMQANAFDEQGWRELEGIGRVVRNERTGAPRPDVLKEVIEGADFAITSWGVPALTADILDRAPNLKAVIHAAGSVKPIVSKELWERGIRVSGGNGQLGIGVAETALGFTIASLKNMWRLTQSTGRGGWSDGRAQVRELYGLTVGVIGAGKAGQHYMGLMRQFSVSLLVCDPRLTAAEAVALGASKAELDELLAASDVVSLHAPSIPSTYRMLNRERLALMKDDAILINTARGSLIDERALLDELRSGRLFACLDVTDPEPPAPDHPLRGLPNCIITPHIAGAVNNGKKRLGRFAVEELRRLLAGEPLLGEVKPEQLELLA